MGNENDIEFRIEKLEFEKEEIEDEIKATEKIIQEMKEMKDRIPIKDINIKVSRYIQDLEYNKLNNEIIKEQLERDINKIIGIEND